MKVYSSLLMTLYGSYLWSINCNPVCKLVIIMYYYLKKCCSSILLSQEKAIRLFWSTAYTYMLTLILCTVCVICIARDSSMQSQHHNSRDRIVVSTLRCGRSNPGSNPGHGSVHSLYRQWETFFHQFIIISNRKQLRSIKKSFSQQDICWN